MTRPIEKTVFDRKSLSEHLDALDLLGIDYIVERMKVDNNPATKAFSGEEWRKCWLIKEKPTEA